MSEFAFATSSLPPLLRAALAGIAFVLVSVALGRRLLKVARLDLSGFAAVEQGFVAAALGAGLLQYVPYSLALAGLLFPHVLRWTTLALIVLLLPDMVASVRAGMRLARSAAWGPVPLAGKLWCVLASVLLGSFAIYAATICELSEDDGYHLAAPIRWLGQGSLAYLPSYTNTNASMGFELLYAFGLANMDAIAAKALNYVAGVFFLGGIVLCARRVASLSAGVVAISLLLITTPLVNLQYVFGLAYVDLGACWMAVTSMLVWLVWYEHQERTPWLYLLALYAGLAGSFKTTAVALALAWMPLVLAEQLRRSVPAFVALRRVVLFGAVSALPVLPWLFRNFQQTGNPLFPMLASIIPTRDWPPDHAEIFGKFVRYYSWGVARGLGMSESQRKLLLYGAAIAVAAAGVVAVRLVSRPVLKRLLTFSATFVAISIPLTGLIQRYWLAGFAGAALVGTAIAYDRWPKAFQSYVPAALLMAVALVTGLRTSPSGHELARDLRIATGISTMEQEYQGSPLWNIWRYINHETPADSRILMAAFYTTFGASTYGAFGVDRTCFATDAHLQAYIRLDTWPAFIESLNRASIDYAVVADREFTGPRLGLSFPAARNEFAFSRRLAEEYGDKVYQLGEVALYRLKLPATGATPP
jgi:hypothetical protein